MSVWGVKTFVNWLANFGMDEPPGERDDGGHGLQCGKDLARTCSSCLSFLQQWNGVRRIVEGRKLNRRLRRLPAPLCEEFVEQLALEMAENPQLFGPIVEFLIKFQKERP